MSASSTECKHNDPVGTVVQRFIRVVDTKYLGRNKRGTVQAAYGRFFRAMIVVRLDDGRMVRGYISAAYDTPEEIKSRIQTQVGERVQMHSILYKWKPTSFYWIPDDRNGSLYYTRLPASA